MEYERTAQYLEAEKARQHLEALKKRSVRGAGVDDVRAAGVVGSTRRDWRCCSRTLLLRQW